MSKVRVYELAKEYGLESRQVLERLSEIGEFARSASSTVEPHVVKALRAALGESSAPPRRPVMEQQPPPQRSDGPVGTKQTGDSPFKVTPRSGPSKVTPRSGSSERTKPGLGWMADVRSTDPAEASRDAWFELICEAAGRSPTAQVAKVYELLRFTVQDESQQEEQVPDGLVAGDRAQTDCTAGDMWRVRRIRNWERHPSKTRTWRPSKAEIFEARLRLLTLVRRLPEERFRLLQEAIKDDSEHW